MWFVALSTFVTIAFLSWQLMQRQPPVPATAGGMPLGDQPTTRHVRRSNHRLDQYLDRLGIPFGAKEGVFALGAASLCLAGAIVLVQGDAVLAGVAAVVLPSVAALALQRALALRDARLSEQLPDAVMMMANALKAGHTLTHAFQSLGRELPSPLGPEFARLVGALQMGQSPEAALVDMRERLANRDGDMLVQAILIQRETGGNLVDVLTNIQTMIRERIKVQGKARALSAQGKVSGLVIGLLPIALFLFLWTSSHSYLMEFLLNPIGVKCMIAAVCGQLVGFVAIHRIVNFPI